MNRHRTSGLAALAAKVKSTKAVVLLLAIITAITVCAPKAHAQPFFRTWVSGTTGTNNTQCSRTQPCQTFAQAVAATNSGGEINCLTPGNFGTVTLSIPVTIDCEGVSNGGIQAGASTTALTIATTGAVNLIGLDINGENAQNGTGVSITSNAVVNIRNCKIYGFTGLDGYAISFAPSSSGGVLVVDNAFIANSGYGIFQFSGRGGASNMTVRNSTVINNNQAGIEVYAIGGVHAGATIEQTTLAFNTDNPSLYVYGAGAVALIGGSTVVNNAVGVFASSGAAIYSFKNNQIGGNGSDDTPLTAYPGGPLN